MPLAISFELSDRDLEHFNNAIKAARDAAGHMSPEAVIEAAGKLLEGAAKHEVPDFIALRLERLDALIGMLRDEGWALPEADRQHVLSALVYFADPKDIIPDTVPVLGWAVDTLFPGHLMAAKALQKDIEARHGLPEEVAFERSQKKRGLFRRKPT